jgi:hypothetical protein
LIGHEPGEPVHRAEGKLRPIDLGRAIEQLSYGQAQDQITVEFISSGQIIANRTNTTRTHYPLLYPCHP